MFIFKANFYISLYLNLNLYLYLYQCQNLLFINPTIRHFKKKNEIDIQSIVSQSRLSVFFSENSGHFLTLPKERWKKVYPFYISRWRWKHSMRFQNSLIEAFLKENGYDWERISQIKIGILPSGSGNDFIKI